MTKIPPAVSVNLCCYNSENFLNETIESVWAQSYKNWELVIINDGSTDSTEKIVENFLRRGCPIVYYRQENRGLGYSRNEALKHSSGRFVAFIDHDDVWFPTKLERQLPLFKDESVDLVYSNFFRVEGQKRQIGYKKEQPQGSVFRRFLRHYPVNIQTVMVRKAALEKLETGFDPCLQVSEEYDLFMRLLYRSKAAYLHEPLAQYRIHGQMSSLLRIDRYPVENAYILEKLGTSISDFETDYASELRYMKAKIGYWHASAEMLNGSRRKARAHLAPFRREGFAFFALHALTFFPRSFWDAAQRSRRAFLGL